MSLDFNKVSSQVVDMALNLKKSAADRRQRLTLAGNKLRDDSYGLNKLQKRIKESKTSLLLAEPTEKLDNRYSAPSSPSEFTILANDGSQIDVSRHSPARYFLINMGNVRLDYGAHPNAYLENNPRLYYTEDELIIKPLKNTDRPWLIEGGLLGLKRDAVEMAELARLAEELETERTALALVDGTLVKWGFESKKYDEAVIKELLVNGFLKELERIKSLNNQRHLTVAGYISLPGSTEVANALRLMLCPEEIVNCDKHCLNKRMGERPCDAIDGIRDRDIFAELLNEGERSGLFASTSKVVMKHYGSQHIYFFYVKLDEEIARIEVPQWVAFNKDKLKLTHALVIDQARRGLGYPAALAEAHEQAVVKNTDKYTLEQMIEVALYKEAGTIQGSAKYRSKQTRRI